MILMNFNENLIEKILENKLFDEKYYISQFNEFDEDMDPLEHYLKKGYMEGKNPSKKFNTNRYLDEYPDVKITGINPLIHYVLFGIYENRESFSEQVPIQSRLLTKEIFDEKLLKKDKYYENRWEYMEEVIEQIAKMDNINNVLELGPYKSPLVRGEDVMDIYTQWGEGYPYPIGNFIHHDCSKVPYPIENKKYDLVIACQALEHFGIKGEQVKIFDEFERISKKAIITLPYKWFRPQSRDHHMIDEKVIDYWARNREPSFEQIEGTRILRIYEFD